MATQNRQLPGSVLSYDDTQLAISASGVLGIAASTGSDISPISVYNNSGLAMTSGSLVYVSGRGGATGDATVDTVALADATAATQHPASLVMTSAPANNAYGTAVKRGPVAFDTAASAQDAPVYLSGTAGAITLTAPSGATSIQQIVGRVKTVAVAGVVDVNCIGDYLPTHTHADAARGGQVTLADAIADDNITAAVWEAKAAAGAISATVDGRASLAANLFDAATLTSKVADDAITAGVWEAKAAAGAISATVDGRASLAANFFDVATVDLKVAVGAIGEDRLTRELSQRAAIDVADLSAGAESPAATALGGTGILSVSKVAGAGTIDITMPAGVNIRILDVWGYKTAANGGAGDTVQLQTAAGAANISSAISLNIADTTRFTLGAGTLDDATWRIAGAGVLRLNYAQATNVASLTYISFMRVV